jgi:Tol biopolymer transport system component
MPRMRSVSALLLAMAVLSACASQGQTTTPSSSITSSTPSSASASATATAAATPAITGLTGHILFTRAGGMYGDETVFVAVADGTGEKQLSDLGGGGGPWALTDGSRITYTTLSADQRATAVTSKLDGGDRVVLPLPSGTLNLGGGPLSPDGQWVMLEGFDDVHPDVAGIYVARAADGSELRRVTQRHFIPGDFSPDGKQLVVFGNAVVGEPPPPGSLWVLNFDGTGLRQVTPDATKVQCCSDYRWSPDGAKILFADPDGGLWTISPDGSNLTKVFQDASGRYAVTPTWSPDGSMILFALDPSANPFAHPINGLYVIRADGTGLTLVLGGNDFKREPVWVSG